MAAAARRRAVLQALSSLGYEVTEGMATAWVEDGAIVLRKAANRDYGVELREDHSQIGCRCALSGLGIHKLRGMRRETVTWKVFGVVSSSA